MAPAKKSKVVPETEGFGVLCLYSGGRFPDLQKMKVTRERKEHQVLPHPEEFIDWIAKDGKGWSFQMISAIPEMRRGFIEPYMVFFPVRSQDGLRFPINECIKAMKGKSFDEETAWRGTIVVAKCVDMSFDGNRAFTDITMADYVFVKNWFLHSRSPPYERLSLNA
ncbi:hypothetical protein FA13DRAFT_1784175 [Coprinellus micaceus]|uniref:Uncharacterized protein n=1 Tax=Coprinellus micaceus TaxID=71717 RepID=A0A4Y7U030_COPMI|nr:hypothetical protein FA13DRAFT_1784175 [Coprinellus micaceus]